MLSLYVIEYSDEKMQTTLDYNTRIKTTTRHFITKEDNHTL